MYIDCRVPQVSLMFRVCLLNDVIATWLALSDSAKTCQSIIFISARKFFFNVLQIKFSVIPEQVSRISDCLKYCTSWIYSPKLHGVNMVETMSSRFLKVYYEWAMPKLKCRTKKIWMLKKKGLWGVLPRVRCIWTICAYMAMMAKKGSYLTCQQIKIKPCLPPA